MTGRYAVRLPYSPDSASAWSAWLYACRSLARAVPEQKEAFDGAGEPVLFRYVAASDDWPVACSRSYWCVYDLLEDCKWNPVPSTFAYRMGEQAARKAAARLNRVIGGA